MIPSPFLLPFRSFNFEAAGFLEIKERLSLKQSALLKKVMG